MHTELLLWCDIIVARYPKQECEYLHVSVYTHNTHSWNSESACEGGYILSGRSKLSCQVRVGLSQLRSVIIVVYNSYITFSTCM